MSHSYTKLLYHIIYSTKNRHPWIDAAMLPRLCEYIGGTVRGEGGVALMVNGMADHIHILASLRQDKALSDVIRAIKACSSGWVHRTYPGCKDFAWQRGYGVFTVSASQVERVRLYIENQQKHHRKLSFQEELRKLLVAHGIEFEEGEVWR